nr:MAG TPA: hypothetical protein [Caudoviricetes sp.]
MWHKYNKIGLFTSFIMKITTKIFWNLKLVIYICA